MKEKSAEALLALYEKEQIGEETLKAELSRIIKTKHIDHLQDKNQSLGNRLTAILNHFVGEYAKADILAVRYQKWYRRASKCLYIMAAIAVLIIAAQYIFELNHWFVLGELFAICGILFIISVGNYIGWHRRWVEYRFLAERLRGGIFMAFVESQQRKDEKGGFSFHWTGGSWVMDYLTELWQSRPQLDPLTDKDIVGVKHFLQQAWLHSQINYHQKKGVEQLEKHERISKAGELFFWLTFLVAILHLLPHILHLAHIDVHILHHPFEHKLLTFLAIALPTLGFACSAIRAHYDYKTIH